MYSASYLEIMLTGTAWDFYGKFAQFIYALNLHFLSFIIVMLQNWRETRQSQEAGIASIVEWRRNYFDIYTMMFVVMFFWMPSQYTTFKAAQHVQEIQNKLAGHENSFAYKEFKSIAPKISEQGEIPMPPGWFVILYGTKASINQITEWINLAHTPTMTKLLTVFNSTKIEDEELRTETNEFFSACYQPTLARFQNETHEPIPKPEEEDNINYVGNNLFKSTPGYYKACTQSQANSGTCYGAAFKMPYQLANRYGIQTSFITATPNANGQYVQYANAPTCYTWWTGQADTGYSSYQRKGLRDQLADYMASELVKDDTIRNAWTWVSNNFLNGDKDILVQKLLKTDPPSLTQDRERQYADGGSNAQGFFDWFQGIFASVGAALAGFTLSVVLETLRPGLALFQAGAIFTIIMMIAIILPIGGFKIETVVMLAIFLFTALILSLWWHIADVLNEGLISILYPHLEGEEDMDVGLNTFLYIMFLFFFYIGIPGYFGKMLGMIGIEAADMTGAEIKELRQAGSKGASKTKVG